MQDVGYAALQIIPSFKDLDKNLEAGTSKAMMAAGVRGGTHYGDAAGRSAGQRFGRMFMSTAKVGLVGLAALTAGAVKLGKDAVAEAREAQKVGALTASTIKATGGAAKVTAKQVADLAEKISLKTGIDDEAIQSGQNMLLTFKNIRNEAGAGNDIFDQTTQTLVDMSSAMGTDAKSSAIQLGKALNDPIKGITALTRVGVTFSEGQKEQIENLVESGRTMDAQKVILKELNSEFGGAAAAQATMGDKVSVAWGNVQEKLGTVLLPLIDDVQRAFLKKGIPAAEKFVGWFEDKGVPAIKKFAGWFKDEALPAIADFADDMEPLAESILPAAGDALEIIAGAAKKAAPHVKSMVDAFVDMPKWAQTAIVGGGMAAFGANKLTRGKSGLLPSLVTAGKPVPVFVTNPGFGPGADVAVTPGGEPSKGGSKLATAARVASQVAVVGTAAYLSYEGGKQFAHDMNHNLPRLSAGPNNTTGGRGGVSDPNADYVESAAITLSRQALEKATGLRDYRAELEKTAAAFKTLPADVQTKIALYGAPESRREVRELAEQYDLTPKQVRTLFQVAGVDSARSKLSAVEIQINNLDGKSANSYMNVITRYPNGVPGGRMPGSANGGTVPKTGMGYADRHPYLLADGEEVISNRYGQADRYRGLLKAINANRGLAAGGTVGMGGGGSAVNIQFPEVIRLRVGDREFDAYIDERADGVVNADRRFQRVRGGH